MRKSQRNGARITAWAALAALTFGWVVVEPLDAQETSTSSARTLKYELQPPPANFSPPTMTIDSPVFNWGSVLRGDLVKHSFKIRNTGGSV
ncbi:MAG TPA: hypothetical protein VK116_02445, partial [Planctomycetota bacterium]|nr:hypothetical protein [Planctomycetota bacterium]